MSLLKVLVAFLFGCGCGNALLAGENNLSALQRDFQHGQMDRETYLDRLATLRERYCSALDAMTARNSVARRHDENAVTAIDSEVKRYPLSPPANSTSLSRLMVGRWDSPRHQYLYKPNHTWTMLPVLRGVTQGAWDIQGNQYVDWVPSIYPSKFSFTIILLDHKYCIFTDNADAVFYMNRASRAR